MSVVLLLKVVLNNHNPNPVILPALDAHLESYISTGYVEKFEHLWHNDIYYTARTMAQNI